MLSVTLFKDELIEWVAEQELKENEKYKPYYIAEIPVEPENFAEDFRSIHEQVLEECSLYEQKSYDIDSLYTSFANRIGDEVQTKTDYAMLLSEYFASLNIGTQVHRSKFIQRSIIQQSSKIGCLLTNRVSIL